MEDEPPLLKAKKSLKLSYQAQELVASLRGVPYTKRRFRGREPLDINYYLEKVLNTYKIGQITPQMTIQENWENIVGRSFAPYCSPAKVNNWGALIINIANSTLKNELSFQYSNILRKVQKLPNCGHINKLLFQII